MQEMRLWLAIIGRELDELSEKGKDWSEKRLHSQIKSIVSSWSDFIDARMSRKKEGTRVVWSYKKQELKLVESTDGKWLILSTDEMLDANEAVNVLCTWRRISSRRYFVC
mgnify:CR=1 FL=1